MRRAWSRAAGSETMARRQCAPMGRNMGLIERVGSEYAYLSGALRILRQVTPIAKNRSRTFPDVLDELAERFGDRVALLSDAERLTYRSLLARANQYARWAAAQ